MGCENIATSQTTLDIATIFQKFYSYHAKNATETKVANDILNCRTEVLGGHLLQCDKCLASHYVFNSCRNRHCPKCQFLKKTKWVEARISEILPVQYFHVVFTIPSELKPLFLINKKICYNLLFNAVSETLKDVAKTRGIELGFTSVLHTWGQKLLDHPHIHVVIPGGGFSLDGLTWIKCKNKYFFPVKILSKVFRGKLLSFLEKEKNLILPENSDIKFILTASAKHDWVVYAKPPFAGPESVINYLGQYTHKVAIANNRIKEISENTVTFSFKDRANNNEKDLLEIPGAEFIRRFLLHVLPNRFCRIRHHGFLARRSKNKKLQKARLLLDAKPIEIAKNETWKELFKRIIGIDIDQCANCKTGKMVSIKSIPINQKLIKRLDSS